MGDDVDLQDCRFVDLKVGAEKMRNASEGVKLMKSHFKKGRLA